VTIVPLYPTLNFIKVYSIYLNMRPDFPLNLVLQYER
jgi:hypothetical protein